MRPCAKERSVFQAKQAYFCCSALRGQRCVSHNSCLFRFQARQEAGKRGGKLASPTRKRVQPAHQPTNLETSCIIFSGINEASYIFLSYLCVWLIDFQTCACINTHDVQIQIEIRMQIHKQAQVRIHWHTHSSQVRQDQGVLVFLDFTFSKFCCLPVCFGMGEVACMAGHKNASSVSYCFCSQKAILSLGCHFIADDLDVLWLLDFIAVSQLQWG